MVPTRQPRLIGRWEGWGEPAANERKRKGRQSSVTAGVMKLYWVNLRGSGLEPRCQVLVSSVMQQEINKRRC